MAIVNIKAEHEGEDIRVLAQEINMLSSGNRGGLSDGYHTFDELYRHRIMLWILTAKMLQQKDYPVYKFHHYEGWFCLGAETPCGQISYHIPESQWHLCDFAIERQPEFDGHTSKDVEERLRKVIEG